MPKLPQNLNETDQTSLQFLSPKGFPQGHKATILIVDDSPDNLRVLSATLTQQNYDIRCAKNGSMALNALQSELPDLILLDIQMPDINGYQVCQMLKAEPRTRQIPIIFISALDEALDKVKAFDVGGVDYITKPFQVEEVLARVRNQLNLESAKTRLAHAERMAGLGQLTAGIAHEINNPVNFIHGNLDYVAEYVQGLLELISLYEAHYPHPHPDIQALIRRIDLEYLKSDLPKVIDSMNTGTERITEIVYSLRNLSRLDESDYKLVDIHEGINSTLLILGHRLKSISGEVPVQVVRDFGELPQVGCYPGVLNQVFMNIIANALDAIDEQIQQTATGDRNALSPQITVRTRQADNQWIEIEIIDNGPGITEEAKHRLFSPFFTTKPVGKGTGLGLAISYQIIVEKHQGQITCQSTVGKGTVFNIKVPNH